MSILPYNRVVNVTMSRNDNFPSRQGFGTPLLLTNDSVVGQVDATHRTKLYASMDEVTTDWTAGTDVYNAALVLFSQNPKPLQFKVGYVSLDSTPIAAELQAQLDLIYASDQEWYQVLIDPTMRDIAALDGLISWIQAKDKIALIDTNDVGHETAGNTTCISARNKNDFDRTGTFYHTDATQFLAVGAAAYMATRVFDDAGSAYTTKFKEVRGASAVNLPSAKIAAITGFTPGIGQSENVGHMANTYIDIGGQNFLVEGSTLTQNVFLDEIHATDWIIARTQEELLAILLNNARVPFTDKGMDLLASAARGVMQQAFRAGIIADDLDENGDYSPAVTYTIPSVFDVPASQRAARIAPAIAVTFRYAGAVHYSTINYTMNF